MARDAIMYLKSVVRALRGEQLPIYEGTGTRVNATATVAATAAAALPGTGTKLVEVRARIRHLAALQAELEGLLQHSRLLDPADCADDDICHILT